MDYRSKRWRRLRRQALGRAGYVCQECRRYGKTAEATTVHHAWPAEDFPDYAWSDWNLVGLCSACHNSMHNRETGKLTVLGEYWRRRVHPPTPTGFS